MSAWAEQLPGLLWRASWQGSLFVLGAWGICRLLRLPPASRYWIWWLASLQLVLRVVSPPILLGVLPAGEALVRVTQPAAPHVQPYVPIQRVAPAPDSPSQAELISPPEARAIAAAAFNEPRLSTPLVLTALWLAAVGLYSSAALVRMVRARRLLERSSPIEDPHVRQVFEELCHSMRVKPCRLLSSACAPCPLLTGLLRPSIVLPRAIAADGTELRACLSHELFHLKRRDLWLGLVPASAQIVLFFNPLAWLCAHESRLASEEECDRGAVDVCGLTSAAYARLLLNAARTSAPMAALGTSLGFRTLQRRIKMLNHASPNGNQSTRIAKLSIGVAALLALPWCLGAQAHPAMKAKKPKSIAVSRSHMHHARRSGEPAKRAARVGARPAAQVRAIPHVGVAPSAALAPTAATPPSSGVPVPLPTTNGLVAGRLRSVSGVPATSPASIIGVTAAPVRPPTATSSSVLGASAFVGPATSPAAARPLGAGTTSVTATRGLAGATAQSGTTVVAGALKQGRGLAGVGFGRSMGIVANGGFGGGGASRAVTSAGTRLPVHGFGGMAWVDLPPGLIGSEPVDPSVVLGTNSSYGDVHQTGRDRFEARFVQAQLPDALVKLFEVAKAPYVLSPDLPRNSHGPGMVTCHIMGLTLEDTLNAILKASPTPLTWRREEGVFYVVPKESEVK